MPPPAAGALCPCLTASVDSCTAAGITSRAVTLLLSCGGRPSETGLEDFLQFRVQQKLGLFVEEQGAFLNRKAGATLASWRKTREPGLRSESVSQGEPGGLGHSRRQRHGESGPEREPARPSA
ncbi:hypothetical protein NQZ68_033832 [Dissostichus eleginoides]|nr:hypothetical protein NQZ68_033832 [Dissostichus eleginoides]